MPAGAVYVGRPTIWGNPFRVTRSSDYHGLAGTWFVQDAAGGAFHPEVDTQRSARRLAVDLFEQSVSDGPGATLTASSIQADLAGHDLVCWCPISEPCHADVLLAMANSLGAGARHATATATEPATLPERD